MTRGQKARSTKNRTPLIALERCSVLLGKQPALDAVSFALRAGERWALIGPNGAGKTLLLKLLRGDVWPTPTGVERRMYCFDGEYSEQPVGVKERIAYVGPERQDRYARYEWNHSVAQVIATGLFDEDIPRTRPNATQSRRVARLLKQFGLQSLRDRGFLTLSHGQRRRALAARAFAGKPKVLLLDEAFNGLDATSADILRRALQPQASSAVAWIVSTHRARDLPKSITHVARMRGGKLLSALPVAEDALYAKERRSAQASPTRRVSTSKPTNEWLIRLVNVDLYRDYRLVLKDVNWTLRRGEHWGVFGRNGSGKSTLLKLLYGDLHPKLGGVIERAGAAVGAPIEQWKRRVGHVSPELQAEYFLARDIEEIAISGRYASVGLNQAATAQDRRAARRWLRFFGLQAFAHRTPRQVSYGQLRLALIARAMINEPEMLLLDEPCSGLDVAARADVLRLLDRLAARGVQLVIAAHHRDDLPQAIGNVLTLKGGRAVEVMGEQ